MTTYFVDSTVADDTGDGLSWVSAKKFLASALVLAAAAGDLVKIDKTYIETFTAAKNYTLANNIAIICVDKTNADAWALQDGTTGYIGSTNTYNIGFLGPYKAFIRGLYLKTGSNSPAHFQFMHSAASDGAHYVIDSVYFKYNVATSSSRIQVGYDSDCKNFRADFINCTSDYADASNTIAAYGDVYFNNHKTVGVNVNGFFGVSVFGGGTALVENSDLSKVTGYFVGNQYGRKFNGTAVNTRFGTGCVPLNTQTVTNNSGGEAWWYNCSAGDIHYDMRHANPLGSTEVSAAIYANDGKTYDGTNRCSWKVASSANATIYHPYVSPWMSQYHDATAAVTPYFECLRDGSATPFYDDEVWPEWSVQATSGYPQGTTVSGRMDLLGTRAAHTASSKGASDWTGEGGTAWFGKLDSAGEVTPAESGNFRGRICIGLPSATVYVDTQIRGI